MPALRGAVRALGLPGEGLLSARALLALALWGVMPSPSPATSPSRAAPPPPQATPAASPGPAEEEATAVRVRFVEPAATGLVLGETRITIEAGTTPDATIVQVALYADDDLLSILEKPPYTLTWDAGGVMRRRLRAVATDSRGRTGQAVLPIRPLIIGQREEVRLVNVYASVRDRRGDPVLDLAREDFVLLEDGVRQTLTHFSAAKAPLTVALLVDASNSMNLDGKIDLARKAAEEFVDSVERDDRLLVLHFNDDLRGRPDSVTDRRRVREDIEAIRAGGGTALYDAVVETSARLAGAEGRRAIVLLSDGRDQALDDNTPGSLHLFEEALEKAHRSEVAIYTIGLGRHLEDEMDLQRVRSLKEILDTLARQTGGRSYYLERAGPLAGIYRQIAADLKHQYALGYTSTNRARDGKWRTITLRVRENPGLQVQARAGYYAPGPGAP